MKKATKIKKCEICGQRPGVNYDGRQVCIDCWRKLKGR